MDLDPEKFIEVDGSRFRRREKTKSEKTKKKHFSCDYFPCPIKLTMDTKGNIEFPSEERCEHWNMKKMLESEEVEKLHKHAKFLYLRYRKEGDDHYLQCVNHVACDYKLKKTYEENGSYKITRMRGKSQHKNELIPVSELPKPLPCNCSDEDQDDQDTKQSGEDAAADQPSRNEKPDVAPQVLAPKQENVVDHLKTVEITSIPLSRKLLIGIGLLCNTFLLTKGEDIGKESLFGFLFSLAGPANSKFEEKMEEIKAIVKAVMAIFSYAVDLSKKKNSCLALNCNRNPYLRSICVHANFYCGIHGEGGKICVDPHCLWNGEYYAQALLRQPENTLDDSSTSDLYDGDCSHNLDQFRDELLEVKVKELKLDQNLEAAISEVANELCTRLTESDLSIMHPFGILAHHCKMSKLYEKKNAYLTLIVTAVLHFVNKVDPKGVDE